jgi:Aspartyl/Asparaginyl beta-hydroxylase
MMKHCQKIAEHLPVGIVMEQLCDHPQLWDEQPLRTKFPGTPFGETHDIWVRFGKDPAQWSGPHFAEFWHAWDILTGLHRIVFDLMRQVRATTLGGILITNVPPGKKVETHNDKGFWHPDFYLCKAYVILQANERCINTFEDESVVMRTGEAWLFNNRVPHGVVNGGDTDRVAAVICMRQE